MIEDMLQDDSDINRELRCLVTRATGNLLNRCFWRCSVDVKFHLLRTFCMCFYDMSLWKYYKLGSMNKLVAAYVTYIKLFFGYARYCSVTVMLLELGLPSFNTLRHNASSCLKTSLSCSVNNLERNAACV